MNILERCKHLSISNYFCGKTKFVKCQFKECFEDCSIYEKVLKDEIYELDTYNEDEIICPYCGEENDSSETYEDVEAFGCDHCEKDFNVSVEHSVTYTTTKLEKEKE